MSRYLRGCVNPETRTPLMLDEAIALGYDQKSPCPLLIPPEIRENLAVLYLTYFSFDGETRLGQLVVHRELEEDIIWVFARLLQWRFPIASMAPIAAFDWDDIQSMTANNTSAWNYRYIAGSVPPRLSMHAFGRAIDINPRQNPCRSNGIWLPPGSIYDPDVPGTLTVESLPVVLFRERGWIWGGNWSEPFDPQHLQKPFPVF